MIDTVRKMGLALAQMGPIHRADTRAAVVKRLVEMLREAKSRQADLVVFPELALTTFFPRYWIEDNTESDQYFETDMPNAETAPLFDEAKKLGIGFYLGYAELTAEGRHFNTSILVDKNAKIIGKYRKIHLPGHAEPQVGAAFQHLEKKYFEVGDQGFRVSSMNDTLIGMCLCNDRRWPETYRMLSLQSAELVVLGYNTPSSNIYWSEPVQNGMFHHLLSLQAGAYQNALWVGAAAKCGSEDGHHMIGGSAIVAPTGEIVARSTSEEDEVVVAKIDLNLGRNYREHWFNFAKHRRPEHYHLIVERAGAGAPL